jgi:hypothetical protein
MVGTAPYRHEAAIDVGAVEAPTVLLHCINVKSGHHGRADPLSALPQKPMSMPIVAMTLVPEVVRSMGFSQPHAGFRLREARARRGPSHYRPIREADIDGARRTPGARLRRKYGTDRQWDTVASKQ